MNRICKVVSFAALGPLTVAAACSSSDKPESAASSTTIAPTTSSQPAGEGDRVVLRGTATLDGQPFNSRWVGAVVLDHGLVTPCQLTLPPVRSGNYAVTVLADTESAGCGASGARVALWVYGRDKILFSTNTIAWPGNGRTVDFAPRYSASKPNGATPPVAQFQGGALAADGRPLPAGTRVEAYVGDTRCGVASVRSSPDFTGYILSVVGPDAVPGCTRGARISFRVNGRPASGKSVRNTPPGQDETLDLTQR